MKRVMAPLLVFLVVIAAGAFFRLNNLGNNVVWDSDASIYSIYSRNYYKIIKIGLSKEFHEIIKNERQSSDYVNIETLIQRVRQRPDYQKLTRGIEPMERSFPDWSNKPAFIITGAIFHFINHQVNSLLYLTALFGILVLFASFGLSYLTKRTIWGSILSTVLIAVSPMLVGYSRTGFPQMAAIFFLTIFFHFFYKSQGSENSCPLVTAGAFLGIAQAYHPIMLIWLFFAVTYEAIRNVKMPFHLVSRVVTLGLGYLPILLILEIFQLNLWHLSLIFTGTPLRSYLYMLFLHGQQQQSPYPFDPFFYVKGISLYEGGIFAAVSCFSLYRILRKKSADTSQERFWLFFFFIPLLFLSLFSKQLPLALRNIPFILIPAYFLMPGVIRSFLNESRNVLIKRRRIAVFIILGLIHLAYAARVNWSNAHFSVPKDGIKAFLQKYPERRLVAVQGNLFLRNMMEQWIPDRNTGEERQIFFYRETVDFMGDTRITSVFQTDAFDKKIFMLEDPKRMRFYFDDEKRTALNRIFFSFQEL